MLWRGAGGSRDQASALGVVVEVGDRGPVTGQREAFLTAATRVSS